MMMINPYELADNDLVIRRKNIQTTQEEGDIIIIQQMNADERWEF